MVLPVDICNRALLLLEEPSINSIDPPYTDASGIPAACGFVYPLERDAELRDHPWSFAITRVSLPADGTPPIFGAKNRFRLPPDFRRFVKARHERRLVEGQYILTDEDGPIDVRYVALPSSTSVFDALFVRALACRIALALAPRTGASAAKMQGITQAYNDAISRAKKVDAIEKPAEFPPEDIFVTARR